MATVCSVCRVDTRSACIRPGISPHEGPYGSKRGGSASLRSAHRLYAASAVELELSSWPRFGQGYRLTAPDRAQQIQLATAEHRVSSRHTIDSADTTSWRRHRTLAGTPQSSTKFDGAAQRKRPSLHCVESTHACIRLRLIIRNQGVVCRVDTKCLLPPHSPEMPTGPLLPHVPSTCHPPHPILAPANPCVDSTHLKLEGKKKPAYAGLYP